MGKRKEEVKLQEVEELNGNAAKRPRRSAAKKVVEKELSESENDVDDPEPVNVKGEEDEEEDEEREDEENEEDEEGEDDDEEKFEVDCLVADRINDDGKTQYKVRWRGYESEDDTWENESNLDCEEIIEEYLESKGEDGEKKTKPKTGAKKKKPVKDEPSVNGEKVADKIVGLHTLKNGTRELLVRWKNLPESADSWEPEERFRGTPVHDVFLVKEKENRAKKAAKADKEAAGEEGAGGEEGGGEDEE